MQSKGMKKMHIPECLYTNSYRCMYIQGEYKWYKANKIQQRQNTGLCCRNQQLCAPTSNETYFQRHQEAKAEHPQWTPIQLNKHNKLGWNAHI